MPPRRAPRRPLPLRDGLGPSRVRLPTDSGARTVGAYLAARFPDDARTLPGSFASGRIVDADGTPLAADAPLIPGADIHVYRIPPPEPRVPFELRVLHRDEDLLVVDKPHFLATMPRGSHITETALVRLRRSTGNEALAPAHRLDRLTAGVLVFTTRIAARRPYQQLFASGAVRKDYEAVSLREPHPAFATAPAVVRSRMVKERGVLRAREVPGEPNARTVVESVERAGGKGASVRLRVRPLTGKTHQLRVHLASVGAPIVGDPLYGDGAPDEPDAPPQWAKPLQLLARSIAFTDPLTGRARMFTSTRTLDA